MNAQEFLREGRLAEAISALNEDVRRDPLDPRLRTFLFEMLCFAGHYDRAEKQLDVISSAGGNVAVGSLLYRAAISAEREREAFFLNGQGDLATEVSVSGSGTLNQRNFEDISDADPRNSGRLEVFGAGRYLRLRFQDISVLQVQPPGRLRDLLWARATIKTGQAFQGTDFGEVFVEHHVL